MNSQDHSQEESESFSSSNTSYNQQEVYVEENNGKIMALARQAKAYRDNKMEEFTKDTMQCIQKYLRRIYRQVKFFSDTKLDFKQPCFVSEEGKKKQTVVLCNWILDNIWQDKLQVEDKVKFWLTYGKHVKNDLNKMRQTDINMFSKMFKKGENNSLFEWSNSDSNDLMKLIFDFYLLITIINRVYQFDVCGTR